MSFVPGFVISDMSTVIMNNVVSVDGFIADAKDQVGPLFDWYVNGDVDVFDGGQIKVSQASADYVKTMWAGIGSMVIGRHLFDITNGWNGRPAIGDHVFVVTHEPPVNWPFPGAPFTFVAVSNTLNTFLGYPHKRWPELADRIDADSRPVVAALARWSGEDLPDDPGLRYFNSME